MSQQRTERVTVRLSPAERKTLTVRARRCQRAISTYLRESALGTVPRERKAVDADLTYQLARIGNNLNQLARVANSTGQLPVARRLNAVLDDIEDRIAKLAE